MRKGDDDDDDQEMMLIKETVGFLFPITTFMGIVKVHDALGRAAIHHGYTPEM